MTELAVNRVVQAVRAVLPRTARVTRTAADRGRAVQMRVNGHPLRAYWLGIGTARAVKEVLGLPNAQRPDVLVARAMSTGAREAASGAGLGWIDELSGAAEVDLDWLVIARSGTPTKHGLATGWTPSFAAVAEALLTGTTPTVEATARATELSEGICTRALAFLVQRGLLSASVARGRMSARRLEDPDRLLDEYSEVAPRLPPRFELQVGVLWRDPLVGLADFGRKWDAARIEWAATGAAAAAVLAPYLTDFGTAEVLVAGKGPLDLSTAAAVISSKPVKGGRLVLKLFPSHASAHLSQNVDGLRVAAWPRVYADLRSVGVRGEDAAEHLREMMRAG